MSRLLRWIFIRLQFSCACPVSSSNNCFLCLKCVFTMLRVAWKSDGSWWFVQSALLSPTPWLPSISNTTAPPRPISATRSKEKKDLVLRLKKRGEGQQVKAMQIQVDFFFLFPSLLLYINMTYNLTGSKKGRRVVWLRKRRWRSSSLCSQDTWQPIYTAPEKRSHHPGPCQWTASSLCSGSRCLARLRLFTLKISSP